MTVISSIQGLVISLVIIIGIVVLIALHDLDANVGIPIIAGLGGVHIGVGASNGSTPPPGTTTTTTSKGSIL